MNEMAAPEHRIRESAFVPGWPVQGLSHHSGGHPEIDEEVWAEGPKPRFQRNGDKPEGPLSGSAFGGFGNLFPHSRDCFTFGWPWGVIPTGHLEP